MDYRRNSGAAVDFLAGVWLGYFTLSKIYRGSQAVGTKPPVSVLQAGYYFQQDKVRCLLAWIMNLCEQGAISLHYAKESYPWSLGLEEEAKASELDQKRLKKVFKEGDRFFLKAWPSSCWL